MVNEKEVDTVVYFLLHVRVLSVCACTPDRTVPGQIMEPNEYLKSPYMQDERP